MVKRKERKRASKSDVRNNASKGGGSGMSWFTTQDGVDEWKPEKAGRYLINVLPYEIKAKDHPDGIDAGTVWYKLPFKVHHGVGPNSQSLICPTSFNRPCPICEAGRKMKDDPDTDEETLRAFNPQRFVAYNIQHPDDEDRVALLVLSYGKFAKHLEKELKEDVDEENVYFYDTTDEGRTLKVRFSQETFAGREYLQASRIDFVPRGEMDEDEVLGKTVCLDEALNILPYDKIKALFFQEEIPEGDEDDAEEDEKPAPKKKPGSPAKKKPEPEPEDDDDLEEDDDLEDDEEDDVPPPPKKKSNAKTAKKPEPEPEDDDEEDDLEDDEEDEPTPQKKSAKSNAKTAKKPAKKKSGSGNACPHGGTFGEDIDEFPECDDCDLWDECDEAKHG